MSEGKEEQKSLVIDDDEKLVFSRHEKYGWTYNRSSSTALEELKFELCKLYELKSSSQCFIVPSGMAAISTVLSVLQNLGTQLEAKPEAQQSGLNLFYGDQLYSDTPKLLKSLALSSTSVSIYPIPLAKQNDFILQMSEEKLAGKINVLFVESCSNPSGLILNHDVVEYFREACRRQFAEHVVIVDNTWLSAVIFNPLANKSNKSNKSEKSNIDADVVVNSLTKYYSNGKAIGGTILLRDSDISTTSSVNGDTITKLSSSIGTWIKLHGLHVSPHNAAVITEEIKTLAMRIAKSSTLTTQLLDRLETDYKNNPAIQHPYLANHPSHLLAKKYFAAGLWPSVFTFQVPLPLKKVQKILEKQVYFTYKTSFGAGQSRIDPFPTQFVVGKQKWTIVRLSVGHRDDGETLLKQFHGLLLSLSISISI